MSLKNKSDQIDEESSSEDSDSLQEDLSMTHSQQTLK